MAKYIYCNGNLSLLSSFVIFFIQAIAQTGHPFLHCRSIIELHPNFDNLQRVGEDDLTTTGHSSSDFPLSR